MNDVNISNLVPREGGASFRGNDEKRQRLNSAYPPRDSRLFCRSIAINMPRQIITVIIAEPP